MLNYVCTVFVSNLASGAVLKQEPAISTGMSTPSTDAGKFIIMNCDPNVAQGDLYNVDNTNASSIQTIKVGIVTKKNLAVHLPDGDTEYRPIIKWSNEIKAADIKSYNVQTYTADTEDCVYIDFDNTNFSFIDPNSEGGKRVIVRLTFKDMPHRYRKWTESYEYVTEIGEDAQSIAFAIKNMINKEWKRARVIVKVGTVTYDANGNFVSFAADANQKQTTGHAIQIEALPYDDDDSVDTLNVANKVRFNANIYFTDPKADGWDSTNKYFPKGTIISKVPGKQYPASSKLVRDREFWGMGYQGILNRGEGTWPIIKPEMETDLNAQYNAITLEFENMYRAADDIQRKTKQNIEIYGVNITNIKPILDTFVSGVQQDEVTNPKVAPSL